MDADPFLDQSDVQWARSFVILHTVRGVKHSSFHHVDQDSAEFYLHDFVDDAKLSPDIFRTGNWYIDVAIEISSEKGHCLQWNTSTHNEVVQQALHISDRDAARISNIGSSKYSRDLTSHLTDVSGFRISPGTRAQGEYEAVYIQAYTTDKAVVYNPDAGHYAKSLSMKEAMGPDQPPKTVEGIHTIYQEALQNNSSSARLEVRVPLKFAHHVLLQFDSQTLKKCLCSFNPRDWWYVLQCLPCFVFFNSLSPGYGA